MSIRLQVLFKINLFLRLPKNKIFFHVGERTVFKEVNLLFKQYRGSGNVEILPLFSLQNITNAFKKIL